MMFAQFFDKVPANAAAWLGCLAFVVFLLNELARARKNLFPPKEGRTIWPQPLDVRAVQEFVRECDCRERHGAIARQFEDQRAETKADRGKIHERIDAVGRQVSAVQTAVDLFGQRLSQIDAKLDRTIERRNPNRE